MHRLLVCVAFGSGVLITTGFAQSWESQSIGQGGSLGNSIDVVREGLNFYGLSVFAGYSTSATPFGQGQFSPGAAALNSDETYGVSASAGWQRHREKGSFSIRYSGGYSGMVHYSDANGYSQSLTLGADRKLGPKWHLSLTASGQDATLAEELNEPTSVSVISQLSSDFDNFAAAFGLGSYTTAQAASAILGAPVVQSPIRALLLGNKIVNYSGNLGLTYAYSRHLSFHAAAFGAGGESRSAAYDGVPATNYVLPQSYGGDIGASWSYSPSPRTDLGVSLDANRLQNHFQTGYTGTATASAGRKMGPHWFTRIYGGGTYSDITQQASGTPTTRQAVGGGALGVKTYDNTFVASYDRSVSDAYGSFIGTYSTISGTWRRHIPGTKMSMFASYGEQQVSNTGFESFSGWTASAGVSEYLTNTTSLNAQYVYFKTGGNYLGTASTFSVQSVRLTMSWFPQSVPR
jgi:hypothetical protein